MFVAICITCLTNDRRGGASRPFSLKRWGRLQQRKPQTHADRPGWAITPLRLFDRIYIHIPHPRVNGSEESGMVSTRHAQTIRPSSVGMIPQLAPHPCKRRPASNAPYARRNFSPRGLHICSCDSGPAPATAYIYPAEEPLRYFDNSAIFRTSEYIIAAERSFIVQSIKLSNDLNFIAFHDQN